MGLEREFVQTSTQTITVAALSTVSSYGAPSFSTSPSTFTACIEPGARMVLNAQGVEEVSTATVIAMTSSGTVGVQDKLTLHDGRVVKMISVDVLNDEQGQHHLEIAI